MMAAGMRAGERLALAGEQAVQIMPNYFQNTAVRLSPAGVYGTCSP